MVVLLWTFFVYFSNLLLSEKSRWMPQVCANIAAYVFGAGFSAGFYIVPLQSLMQKLSPDDERGRFLGTANAISFTFLGIASIMYSAIRSKFGDEPQHIFFVSAALMAIGAAFFIWRLRGTGILFGTAEPTATD